MYLRSMVALRPILPRQPLVTKADNLLKSLIKIAPSHVLSKLKTHGLRRIKSTLFS